MAPHAPPNNVSLQRTALRKQLNAFSYAFNKKDWERCFQFVDPKLRAGGRVNFPDYSASLARFFERYGPVHRIYTKINPYLNVTTNRHDDRPFAYAIVFWQDKDHAFHVFRERWVKENDSWYTRVAGLVAHQKLPAPPGETGGQAAKTARAP
jgi:hypothetical protein